MLGSCVCLGEVSPDCAAAVSNAAAAPYGEALLVVHWVWLQVVINGCVIITYLHIGETQFVGGSL